MLSAADDVGPLSIANHWRSLIALCTPNAFFRQMFPPSVDTATPTFRSPSRSTKYANPRSSVTTSVSPPPGGASGRSWIGDTMWYESPPSTDLWTKLCWVDVPHGPDSQMFPERSTWTIGSPSVRCGSTTTLGANAIPPVGHTGFGAGPPGVKTRLACPEYPEFVMRNGTTRTSYVPGGGARRAASSTVVPPAADDPTSEPSGPKTYRSKSLSLLAHVIRIVTWPVFWSQKFEAMSRVRKKWSQRTFAGSVAGGHSSGTVVEARTYVCPVHVAVGAVVEIVPEDGVAARAGTDIAAIARAVITRATARDRVRDMGHLSSQQSEPRAAPGSPD